ncbi:MULTISPECIES: ABC transporter permease [Clostridium]|uniref:ABC transporter permease n=1 Tax=Clostridium TaxID=1485 RepID=UPI0018AA8E3F|nr:MULTISPECIES: ABC-2 family transporter protein [Clostridium]MBS5305086.1 ABC-2 family transporter protein [Clostridium sp.]MDB1932361.1 ABC-2 family transporter protein [Clostridium tertium]MDB1936513.1 ABC-2 family transporter protein [Clostridium tertium]MDB1942908.1 ABC-2 family transporter protein [Clostridium tertium]MDB1950009.1 ABC-2 family transporter protein [Clostridium tertium]
MKSFFDIKSYLTFTKNTFQKSLSYRANAIIFFLGDLMLLFVTFYLWKAIYRSSNSMIIKGFNLNEMIVYVLISFITSVIVNADIAYIISREVREGSIAINLIRPINYQKRMFFESLGNLAYNFIVVFFIGFVVVTILKVNYSGEFSIDNIILYFISIFAGFFINFYYSYIFGLLSFKITNMWGLTQIMNAISQLLSGALIPIVFFPSWMQEIFNFLPFSSMIYTPSMIYLGKLTNIEIIKAITIQFSWVIILMIIGKQMWKALIKELTILGG